MHEEPELPQYLSWVMSAFTVLSNARGYGYTAPNPIALSEIRAYCELNNLKEQEDIDDLIYLIQMLDHVWMNNVLKQIKTKTAKSKGRNVRS